MKITGIKSICCGKGVKTRPQHKIINRNDRLYVCLGCKKDTDAYFMAEIIRKTKGGKI